MSAGIDVTVESWSGELRHPESAEEWKYEDTVEACDGCSFKAMNADETGESGVLIISNHAPTAKLGHQESVHFIVTVVKVRPGATVRFQTDYIVAGQFGNHICGYCVVYVHKKA